MLLADMDPFLHHAVETGTTYDFNSRDNRYFTINGRSFPDTIQNNGSGAAAEPAVRGARADPAE